MNPPTRNDIRNAEQTLTKLKTLYLEANGWRTTKVGSIFFWTKEFDGQAVVCFTDAAYRIEDQLRKTK